jgi:hypothetical protein
LFMNLAVKQSARVTDEKITTRFIKTLIDLLTAGDVYTLQVTERVDEERSKKSEFIGWNDTDYYYLITGKAIAAVVKYYKDQGGFFTTTKTTLLKMMDKEGMIFTTTTGGRTFREPLKKITGKPTRLMHLKKEVLT